jgi:hypothetical protein
MIAEVPFTLERWRDVVLQPEQRRDHGDAMTAFDGPTWTYVDEVDHCLAVGGLYPVTEHVAVAWAYIGRDAGRVMPALFLKARRVLRAHRERWPIIRSGALVDFAAGHRLLELLGFKALGVDVTHEARVISVFEWSRGH